MVESLPAGAALALMFAACALVASGMLVAGRLLGGSTSREAITPESPKHEPFECGAEKVAPLPSQFPVKYYRVAILFLLFDVEIVFMWPWATAFYRTATTGQQIAVEGGMVGKGFLLAGMGIFFALLVFGLFYEWKRGAFKWD